MSEDGNYLAGQVAARPVRIAFLVQEDEFSPNVLKALFSNGYSRWGGRFTLIVPLRDGAVHPNYEKWLKAYDPDIIYSYSPISEDFAADLVRAYGPSHLLEHTFAPEGTHPDANFYAPNLPFVPVTSLSALLRANKMRMGPASRITLIDRLYGDDVDEFVEENFGTYYGTMHRSIPDQVAGAVDIVTIASASRRERARRAGSAGHTFVGDGSELLSFAADNATVMGLSQLAAEFSPKLHLGRHDPQFEIVIGDSFADKLDFWNRASWATHHSGFQLRSLIVSPEKFSDNDFVRELSRFIVRRALTRTIALRSASLSRESLGRVASQLNGYAQSLMISLKEGVSIDDVPPMPRFGPLRQTTHQSYEPVTKWIEFRQSKRKFRPPVALPQIFGNTPPGSSFGEGVWAVDIELQASEELPAASNISNAWHLPRRLPIHRTILRPYASRMMGTVVRYPRATNEGYLTTYIEPHEILPEIELPDPDEAIQQAITIGLSAAGSRHNIELPAFYERVGPSDKGQYLTGALKLFGGLFGTHSVLLKKFWSEVFARAGAEVEDVSSIIEKLQDEYPSGVGVNQIPKVVRRAKFEVGKSRLPDRTISYTDLRARHEQLLVEEAPKWPEQDREDVIETARASLAKSVQWLCRRGAIFQGYELRCERCLHNNWIGISSFKQMIECEVCRETIVMPLEHGWQFRLQGFLQAGVREHGMRAQVWALWELARRAHSSFSFIGPTTLHYKRERDDRISNAKQEADLICVSDGSVIMCEAKSSTRALDVVSLTSAAQRLLPDEVVLAVMEQDSPRLQTAFSLLKDGLVGTGVQARLLSFDAKDFDDSPFLPFSD